MLASQPPARKNAACRFWFCLSLLKLKTGNRSLLPFFVMQIFARAARWLRWIGCVFIRRGAWARMLNVYGWVRNAGKERRRTSGRGFVSLLCLRTQSVCSRNSPAPEGFSRCTVQRVNTRSSMGIFLFLAEHSIENIPIVQSYSMTMNHKREHL